MDNQVDLLKIKIEKAKRELPEATLNAIAAVDWRTPILGMRQSKGYSFEQLGDLELETELLLCGLVSPEDYPKELEKRMGISKAQANELVNEMNELVFKKIRAELVKSAERKKTFAEKSTEPAGSAFNTVDAGREEDDHDILRSAGIEIIEDQQTKPPAQEAQAEKSSLKPMPSALDYSMPKEESHPTRDPESPQRVPASNETHPILAQKLSNSVKHEVVETDHSLQNLQTSSPQEKTESVNRVDPYREIPE